MVRANARTTSRVSIVPARCVAMIATTMDLVTRTASVCAWPAISASFVRNLYARIIAVITVIVSTACALARPVGSSVQIWTVPNRLAPTIAIIVANATVENANVIRDGPATLARAASVPKTATAMVSARMANVNAKNLIWDHPARNCAATGTAKTLMANVNVTRVTQAPTVATRIVLTTVLPMVNA